MNYKCIYFSVKDYTHCIFGRNPEMKKMECFEKKYQMDVFKKLFQVDTWICETQTVLGHSSRAGAV